MTGKLISNLGLLLLAVAFLVFNMLNNTIFSGLRIDLTENQLYTLSDGTHEIIDSIDEPINLYFFFSEETSAELTGLRAYATRVQELLEGYALIGGEKINLRIIDPEPFSEAEDQAAEFGLQSVPASSTGEDLYFGLAATNSLDDVGIISFFQPDKEEFLEYEVSRLIQTLILVEKPKIGILSLLKVNGDLNMQTFAQTPPWMSIGQLGSTFEVVDIDPAAESLPDDLDVLLLIHPKSLAQPMQFAIDQYVMKGGKLLAFVDPLAEMDRPERTPMMSGGADQASSLNLISGAWGVSVQEGKVVGDSQTALQVGGPDGTPMRHLAILGLGTDNLSRKDVVTANLESINLATAGIIEVSDDASVNVEPLLTSSAYSQPLDAMQFQFMNSPDELQQGFTATGEEYVIGARLSGAAGSAFPEGIEGFDGEVVSQTDKLNVILVADTDLLTDRMWVRLQDFFGQQLATPFADNGDLVVNLVDNLSGSGSLISIRSRGRFTRPFDVVQDLRRKAESRYLESANDLQAQLAETERKLSELQGLKKQDAVLTLSPEQEAELDRFQAEKLRIRKQLRDVRHQLDSDIESLGATVKFLNIALIPILLTLGMMLLNYLRLQRRGSVRWPS